MVSTSNGLLEARVGVGGGGGEGKLKLDLLLPNLRPLHLQWFETFGQPEDLLHINESIQETNKSRIRHMMTRR